DGGADVRLERVHPDGVGLLGWDRGGRLLTAGTFVGSLQVWELSRPGVHATLTADGPVQDFALSPDGRHVAVRTSRPGPAVALFRRGSPDAVRRLPLGSGAGGGRLLFRPDGRRLALVSSRLAVVWDVDSGKEELRKRPDLPGERWLPGAFLADGRL